MAPEFKVTPQTPPTLLVQTEDDPVHVENSLTYYAALKKNKVPAEMHIFATGGHGYGLRKTAEPVTRMAATGRELAALARIDYFEVGGGSAGIRVGSGFFSTIGTPIQ